jgi:hypothetical protein
LDARQPILVGSNWLSHVFISILAIFSLPSWQIHCYIIIIDEWFRSIRFIIYLITLIIKTQGLKATSPDKLRCVDTVRHEKRSITRGYFLTEIDCLWSCDKFLMLLYKLNFCVVLDLAVLEMIRDFTWLWYGFTFRRVFGIQYFLFIISTCWLYYDHT